MIVTRGFLLILIALALWAIVLGAWALWRTHPLVFYGLAVFVAGSLFGLVTGFSWRDHAERLIAAVTSYGWDS